MRNSKRKTSVIISLTLIFIFTLLSLTLVACEKPNESYKVTFVVGNTLSGNVSGTCDSGTSVEKGKTVTVTATPSDDGYKFIGWYCQDQLKSSANPYEFTVTEEVSLVAKFEELWHHHNYKHLSYSMEDDIIYRITQCSCGDIKKAEFNDYTAIMDTSELNNALISTGEKDRLIVLDNFSTFDFVDINGLDYFDENLTIMGKDGASINGMMINSGKDENNANASTDVMPSGVTIMGVEFTKDLQVANCSMDKLTISNCTFTNGAGIAIRPNSYDGLNENLLVRPLSQRNTVSNVTIENCTFERNANVYEKSKIYLFDINGATIKNNIITNCEYNAIQINNKSYDGIYGNIVIEGNQISDTMDRALRITHIKGNITIKNNEFSYINTNPNGGNKGEIIKADSIQSTTEVVFEGNTLDNQPLTIDGFKVQGLN